MESLPPPPGIINSIRAGFDTIASHVWAIFLPFSLNLFLWLGPRLRVDELFLTAQRDMMQIWKNSGIPAQTLEEISASYRQMNELLPQFNLFSLLRTLPVGISSMVFPANLAATPVGQPVSEQVGALGMFGWIFLLTFFGWVGGGLYYFSVMRAAFSNDEASISIWRALSQTVMMSFFFTFAVLLIGFPLLFVLGLLAQISGVLINVVLLILSLLSMWVIVPVYFWPHGVFIKRQNFFAAITSSLQLTRFTLPTSSLFVLTVFLLSVGLNYLWTIPPKDSWVTLLGIFGHSFVATALLAASFIYYKNTSAWLQAIFERLKSNATRSNKA